MTEALLRTLVAKGINEDMRADSGFKPQVWTIVAEAVQKVAGKNLTIDKRKCVSKLTSCKENWKIWQALTSLSGFAVDENGCVVAESQAMKDYLLSTKMRKSTGEKAMTIESLLNSTDTDDADEPAQSVERDASRSVSWSVSPIPGDSQSHSESEDSSDIPRRKRSSTSSSVPRPVEKRGEKVTSVERFSRQMMRIADGLNRIVESLNKDYQLEAIPDFLKAYHVLDERMKFAIIRLFGTEFNAKTFVSLTPRSIQKQWVALQLRSISASENEAYRDFVHLCEDVDWSDDGELALKSRA
ncbi:hypothetical protein K458DRAFT_436163 [Lentithecium fluviatile CBS 122367]|uniref:Myb/SANT-like domain-containing protein n=1 Tax=Lentithecium fluviatile CBS 122367 TaxID=1168545 RepID=A0A6G1III4_9PLEO|nr:hypothetical protein K458DRAFT_436163 [Lentithecium fluviatile CBS 122367]